MQISWLHLIIIAGISASFFNTWLRKSLRGGSDPTAYGWWFEFIRLIFFALLIPLQPFFDFSWAHLGHLLLVGLVELVAIYLYMKMHASNELSLSTILLQLRTIYVPILAFFVLGEHLSVLQWVGIALIVSGAIVVSRPRVLRADKALSYALLAGVFTAISSITIKVASGFASIPIVITAFSLPSVLLLPLLMHNARRRLLQARHSVVSGNLPASLANIVSMYTMVWALSEGNASQVSGVFQGVNMISVVVGIFFLGEQNDKLVKLGGALLTTLGIILLV